MSLQVLTLAAGYLLCFLVGALLLLVFWHIYRGNIDLRRLISEGVASVVPKQLVLDFLFGGMIDESHKTKVFAEKFATRYAKSVDALNRAISLSVAFVPIALLPTEKGMKLPLIGLDVSYQNWLRVSPAISYGLQIFTLVALCWLLIMRRGLDVLNETLRGVEYFGDVSNIMLTGIIGSLWMFVAVRQHLASQLHRLWFFLLFLLFGLVIFSPSILCIYFVYALFVSKDFVPAVIYLVLLFPSAGISFVLVALSIEAGRREAKQ